jgi:hypothetical protein
MKYTNEYELLSFILEKDELIDDYSFEQFIHEANLDEHLDEQEPFSKEV